MQRDAVIALLERIHDSETPSAEVDEARDVLAKAVRAQDGAALHDVHPEWLLKVLECETPRVIAILLRYVPSRQARYVMDRLPSRIKDRMPQAVDAFSVPTPIVQMLRRRFESHFVGTSTAHYDALSLGALAALGFDELPRFFRDLGVHEMALAFADADDRSIQILMKRLPEADARRLQERMHHVQSIPALARDAKFTILDVNTAAVPADEFLFEIGVRAFAKACGTPEQGVIRAISLKLEPRIGEWLMSTTTHKAGGRGELGKLRQQMVLDRMETLSKAGVLGA